MQEGQNETWNHAQGAREHVGQVIEDLAKLYGTIQLDYPELDEDFPFVTTYFREMREQLRCASSHLTEIMVSHKSMPDPENQVPEKPEQPDSENPA